MIGFCPKLEGESGFLLGSLQDLLIDYDDAYSTVVMGSRTIRLNEFTVRCSQSIPLNVQKINDFLK